MDSIKIELPRVNNVFSYVLVVSTLVFLYLLHLVVGSWSPESIDKIFKLVFWCSVLSVIFWQFNGNIKDLCDVNYPRPVKEWAKKYRENYEENYKKFSRYQVGLMVVFLGLIAVLSVFIWKSLSLPFF